MTAQKGSRRLSREDVYQALEKRLKGRKGQRVVLPYIDKVDGKGYFRSGLLDDDKPIYEDSAGFLTEARLAVSVFISYPIGSFKVLTGLNGPTYQGDIFGKYEGLSHNPPPLDDYLYFGQVQGHQLSIGEEEAKEYFEEYEGFPKSDDTWFESFLANGPDERFLDALKMTDAELAATGDEL